MSVLNLTMGRLCPFVPVLLFGPRFSVPSRESVKPSPNALNPWPTRFNDKGVGSCFITSHSWLKPETTAGPSVVATLNNVAIC